MKQLFQSVRTGETRVVELPLPQVLRGAVQVRIAASLVSAGTERTLTEFASKSILAKARSRPYLVRQVLDKAKQEGVLTTLESVRNRLDQPLALGYSCSGVIIAVGERTPDFQVGDQVACAGGGYAFHAEVVCVPKNLVVKLAHGMDIESAAFTTLGAIALQGIRLAEVRLGEIVAVIGLGLLGQLTVQMLKVAGCTVIGMDIRPDRADLAKQFGADAIATTPDHLSALCRQLSAGHGADAVLITADTASNQPVELAGGIARDKGIVVAVGAVGMNIPRKVYYEKELDFRISRSYGPGRYDPEYEEKGHDYPISYVRWTENRNLQAFVQLLAEGKVNVNPLITHRFPIEEATKAYDLITGKTGEPSLGVLITYPHQPDLSHTIVLEKAQRSQGSQRRQMSSSLACSSIPSAPLSIGLIGAGNFATAILLPAMKRVPGIELIGVCTATGLSARHTGDKFGFRYCTTDENEIFNDPKINTIVIATRHHLHARLVIAALNAGKHAFCEKPLCLNEQQLAEIVRIYNLLTVDDRAQTGDNARSDDVRWSVIGRRVPVVMVGFNRRFAPMALQLKGFLTDIHEPLIMHYRVNAGYIPPDHWVHDPYHGGGRLLGEVCHFVDFLSFLADALPARVQARALPNNGRYRDDNAVITLEFGDGSLGTITYVANGDKGFPKERVEIFSGGAVAVLDDFRRLELVRNGRKKAYKSRLRQDKGHRGEWEAFVASVCNSIPPPIPFESIVTTTLTTFALVESLRHGVPTVVGPDGVEGPEGAAQMNAEGIEE